MGYRELLEKCIEKLEAMDNKHILDGLGELVNDSQKDSLRAKLKNDAIFSLKLMLNQG